MARRRYISTDISTDKKVAELSEKGLLPLLLFTWAVPHMDDWGRITGDAREFKLLVCPGLDVTTREVDAAINDIVEVGLWVRYEVDGKKCIAWSSKENWFKHQSYINKDKRNNDSGSSFPAPPQNTADHRRTPSTTEDDRETPQNTVSLSPSPSPSPSISTTQGGDKLELVHAQIFNHMQMSGLMHSFVAKCLDKGHSEQFIAEVMLEAAETCSNGKPSVRFMEAIVDRWEKEGIKSREENRRRKPAPQKRRVETGKPKLGIYQAPSGRLEGEKKEELHDIVKYLEGENEKASDQEERVGSNLQLPAS